MIVSELLYDIRQMLTDTNEPYLWEDNELLRYIADTIQEVFNFTNLNKVSSFPLTTTANISVYPLSAEILRVYDDATYLDFMPYDMFTSLSPELGKPTTYSYDTTNLYLYPKPDTAYIFYIDLHPLYNEVTSDTIITFPYPEAIKYGTIYRAYLKQDSQTYDPQSYLKFKQEYFEKLKDIKNRVVRDYNISKIVLIHQGLL